MRKSRLERAAEAVVTKTVRHPGLPDAMRALGDALRLSRRDIKKWHTQSSMMAKLIAAQQAPRQSTEMDQAIAAGHELLRELIRSEAVRESFAPKQSSPKSRRRS